MNLVETTQLLKYINLHDKRQVDELVIRDWQDLLGDLDYRACFAAVREHRMTSTAYLLPAHVREGAKRFAQQRRAEAAVSRPAVESGPASFQRSAAEQDDIRQNIARLRQTITQVTGGKPMPQPDLKGAPVPARLGPRPSKQAQREEAERLEAERVRQLRALEITMREAEGRTA